MPARDYLAPPRPYFIQPETDVPLSPPVRPPFSHYHSSSTLPATPRTPYPATHMAQTPSQPVTSGTRLRPYLTLPPRLLLVFLTPAVLPLILTIAHLFQNRSSTASLAQSLKSGVLSACDGLAKGAASIQTMPRYLAMQTNQEVIRATQASILAIGTMLMDSVTIIETVVTYLVDTYRSMLLCTIELAVRGTLDALIGAVQLISQGVTATLNTIRTDIQNDVATANSAIQTAVGAINSVTKLVDVSLNVPQFSIPSLAALQNVTIPTSFEDALVKLNSSIPSLDDLKQKIDQLIETPFQMLINDINSTRLEIAASFNGSLLPVPSISSLSADDANSFQTELCGNLDNSLIDDTANALHKLSTIAIGLMFLLLILVWGALCFWEWRSWRALKKTVDEVEGEWREKGLPDAWRTVAIVEHPLLLRYGSRAFDRFRISPQAETNIRWYLSYLSHPTCLALLFIAGIGFLSLQFQLVALQAIKHHAQNTANSTVDASADALTTKLNNLALNSSQSYADEFNTAIATYETRINDELFGSWLNTTAVTLNSTLVEFYNGIEEALNDTFGGTILYAPINTFIYCILGSKVTKLEEGLTWVSDHAQVTLPVLPPDVLLLSNSSMNEIAQPIASAAVGSGSGSNGNEGVVGSLIDHYESALTVERNFYAIMLGIWLGFALIGLLVVFWNSGGRDRYTAWKGRRPRTEPATGQSSTPKWKAWMGHPIFNQHLVRPQAITTVNDFPLVVEPQEGQIGNDTSFFNLEDEENTARPTVPRNLTSRSISSIPRSLWAPRQAFLEEGSTLRSGTGEAKAADEHRAKLVHGSSKKYNLMADNQHIDEKDVLRDSQKWRGETTNSFQPWRDKYSQISDHISEKTRSFLTIRGERLGKEIQASARGKRTSVHTDKSFGQAPPTPMKPTSGGYSASAEGQGRGGEGRATFDAPGGRPLDGLDELNGASRYPDIPGRPLTSGSSGPNAFPRETNVTPSMLSGGPNDRRQGSSSQTNPWPMESVPTPTEIRPITRTRPKENPFNDPSSFPDDIDPIDHQQYADMGSPDVLKDVYDGYDEEPPDDDHRWIGYASRPDVVSPTSSTTSSIHRNAHVQSANKVHMGTAPTQLAAIIEGMKQRTEGLRAGGSGGSAGNHSSTASGNHARGGKF